MPTTAISDPVQTPQAISFSRILITGLLISSTLAFQSGCPAPKAQEPKKEVAVEPAPPQSEEVKTDQIAAGSTAVPAAETEVVTQSAPETESSTIHWSLKKLALEFSNETLALGPNPIISRGILTAEEAAEGWIAGFDGETRIGWKGNDVENMLVTRDATLLLTENARDTSPTSEVLSAHSPVMGILRTDYRDGGLVPLQEFKTWTMTKDKSGLLPSMFDRSFATVKLKEVRTLAFKPAEMESLFDGETLTGWREVPGNKAKFEVVDHAIQVTGGLGFLETQRQFDNFILQFKVKSTTENSNSGVFYRANTGTESSPSDGYELQVDNSLINGDRTKPANSGTGAIFRRAPARLVVGNDFEWQTVTLVVNKNHHAVWVNGLLVVDWTDDRDPDDNPRRGSKISSGHLSLQGHDPGTGAQFKDIQIQELKF